MTCRANLSFKLPDRLVLIASQTYQTWFIISGNEENRQVLTGPQKNGVLLCNGTFLFHHYFELKTKVPKNQSDTIILGFDEYNFRATSHTVNPVR